MKKLLTIAIFCCLFSACHKGPASESDILPAQRAENVVMRETVSGTAAWQLKAKTADFYDNQDVSMEEPKIVFNQGQEGEASLTSKKGTFKNNIITFLGSVVVRSKEENLKLTTEKLFYNTATKVAWTDVPFVLKRSGVTIKGKALKADNGFSNIEIFKQVTDLPDNLEGLKALQ